MSDRKTILVPTDFSDGSRAALKYACELADALKGSLCVLHVVESYPVTAYAEFFSLPQEFFDKLEQGVRSELAGVLTREQKEKYHATMVLRHGFAAQEILQYLQEHPRIDMVVMATHGRGGVARLMLGSVADKVVRAASCPVLTVRFPNVEESEGGRAA